jgi:hypothetical protein
VEVSIESLEEMEKEELGGMVLCFRLKRAPINVRVEFLGMISLFVQSVRSFYLLSVRIVKGWATSTSGLPSTEL